MSHELDTTTGRAAIAYVGETPWHGLGQKLSPGADLLTWQQESGLDWECLTSPVQYMREGISTEGHQISNLRTADGQRVLYRSDSGEALSVVSDRYRVVQPRDIIEFYRDLTERFGFQLETAGSLKGGRKIWALANTKNAFQLPGTDRVGGYLLLATSFDGSMATQARFTSVRVVCNNTITIATQGRADVTVRHSTDFDASKVKMDLRIGEGFGEFERAARAMAGRPISQVDTARFLLDVYHGLGNDDAIRAARDDEKQNRNLEKFLTRMQTALFNSPGAQMESARGMLWGVLNAVTYDIDHATPARNQENRLDSAWFGKGETIKERALEKALALI